MKKTLKSLLILFACVSLFGCTNEEIPNEEIKQKEDISYTTQQVLYAESQSFFSMKTYMQTATVDSVTYFFEKSVSEEERLSCIDQTAAWLDRLGYEQELSVYIYDENTYQTENILNGSVYTYVRDWNNPEYLMILIRSVYGEFCNYGMAYGYANYLCDAIDVSDLKFEDSFEFYDLNDLCFHPNFVSDDERKIAKNVANKFVSDYINANGEDAFIEILKASGNVNEYQKANDALSAFYKNNGIETVLSDLLYGFGGQYYNYTAKCEYANIFVQNDWHDSALYLYPAYPMFDGFLNNNYPKTKDYFSLNLSQMKKYQNHFALDNYNNDLDIIFTNYDTSISEYRADLHRITLAGTVPFMHEYIHSLTSNSIGLRELWAIEGFADYYELLYNEYPLDFWYHDSNTYNAHPYMQQFRDSLGREVNSPADFLELDHIISYYFDQNPNDSYQSGSSFVSYLINTFGERPFLDYLLINHDLTTLTDKTFDELVDDWKAYLEENYSEYGRK